MLPGTQVASNGTGQILPHPEMWGRETEREENGATLVMEKKQQRGASIPQMRTTEDFLGILDEYMGHIQLAYREFADKHPVMELELTSRKIYSYPYSEYSKMLSSKDQKFLKKQYADALRDNEILVFVRDNTTMTLKSCKVPIAEMEWGNGKHGDG